VGLVNMQKRAGLYAGTVTAGRSLEGGWAVHADLDLES
jgi:hypothetical protein